MIVRIIAIFTIVEFMIDMILACLPETSPATAALIDVSILVLASTPCIYFGVINPYIIANNELIVRINRLVQLDELTQLGNRRALVHHYARFISTNARQKSYGAVFCLDLDMFKQVNDEFGHAAGDAVLIELATRVSRIIRKENIVCRVGGDEFIILMSMLNPDYNLARQKAAVIATRLANAFKQGILFNDQYLKIGVSIGVNVLTPEVHSMHSVLKNADAAMYQAKQSSTQKIYFYEPDVI